MTEDNIFKGTRVDLKHEEKIIQPEEIHHILMPGELGAVLELIVTDPNTIDPLTGKPKITEHRVMKSRSFVRQFLELLFVKMALAPTTNPISVRDTTNNPRSVASNAGLGSTGYLLDVNAAITTTTFGIVIGTGAVDPTIDDFQLGAQIAHATMNYSATAFGTPVADATISQVTITRNFSNVSGAPQTVNEIGLYCRARHSTAIGYFMLIRDTIVGGMVVPDGQTLTANYRPQAVA